MPIYKDIHEFIKKCDLTRDEAVLVIEFLALRRFKETMSIVQDIREVKK